MQDTVLHGKPIQEGDKVVLYDASANRDESVFDGADQFDIMRSPNPHLAFGTGTHFCLGATLARLEIQILFEALMRRFPHMEPTGDTTRLLSNYVNGVTRLMVRTGEG